MEIQKLKEMILSNEIDLMTLASTIIVQKDLILPVFSIINSVIPGKGSHYDVFLGWIQIRPQEEDNNLLVYKKNKGILIYHSTLYIIDNVKKMLEKYNNELQSVPKERIIEYGKDNTNA